MKTNKSSLVVAVVIALIVSAAAYGLTSRSRLANQPVSTHSMDSMSKPRMSESMSMTEPMSESMTEPMSMSKPKMSEPKMSEPQMSGKPASGQMNDSSMAKPSMGR